MSDAARLLLDVNALLALGWPNHQFHDRVVRRLERAPAPSWCTCALTELGFVRLSSNPAVVGVQKSPAEAIAVLEVLTADRRHVFLDRLPALVRHADYFERLLGHQQVTDAYVLAVAKSHRARLLTLDARLAAAVPLGAPIESLR